MNDAILPLPSTRYRLLDRVAGGSSDALKLLKSSVKASHRSLGSEAINRPGSQGRSQFLPGRSEQDLVDIHVVRLAHGEGHHICEGFGGDGVLLVERADAFGDV